MDVSASLLTTISQAIQKNYGRTETFIIYDESSSPNSDDCIIAVDYPMDLSRRSSTYWVVAESEAKRKKTETYLYKIQPRANR